MKRKHFWLIKPQYIMLIILTILLTAALFFVNRVLFYVFAPIVLLCIGLSVYRMFRIQSDIYGIITSMGKAVSDSHESSLINFPIPAMIVSEFDEIIWYNDIFNNSIIKKQNNILGKTVQSVFTKDIFELGANQGIIIEYMGKFYEVFSVKAGSTKEPIYMVYLIDITVLQTNMNKSIARQPVVMMVLIDNYDDIVSSDGDSDDSRLISDARNAIQEFVNTTNGFIKRLEKDKYVFIVQKSDLDVMIQNRFDVLDKVRGGSADSRTSVTLSIGISVMETTFDKAERDSRQALDMALGRGGDQAVIKTEGGYEFFGGYSKGVEKRTKVKTRIVASALVELIKSSDDVLIMGHKFADLDCLGSSIGLSKAIRCLNKPVHIVLDIKRNLADCMVQRLIQVGEGNIIYSPDDALSSMSSKTLLIILDTHAKVLVESQEVYYKATQVVVIDHHRKVVNHIDNAVIFHHEPYASSASEMVTELVQYFGDDCKLTYLEAEALLAGIMLDTRNFIIRAGVRTFEAAAYLRRLGADTVEVRSLFASSMDSYQRKTRVVSSAEIYKNCAIAVCDFFSDDLRIVAPQAADELLGISGVKASFVLYEQNDIVYVSARSMGAINVQVAMEKMGGGGHHTMAGAQILNSSCDKVRQQLLEVIEAV